MSTSATIVTRAAVSGDKRIVAQAAFSKAVGVTVNMTDAALPTKAAAIRAIVDEWLKNKKVDLVFQGGGVLGIGLVGAYSVLDDLEFKPQNVAGTSAGSIVATLIAAGYSGKQIRDIIFDQEFSDFIDPVVPVLGDSWPGIVSAILSKHGVYRGEKFKARLDDLLRQSPNRIETFDDVIVDEKENDPRYRYRLHLIASDVTGRQILRLPIDAKSKLGIPPGQLRIADAVRMSMSIPMFFVPVRKKFPRDADREHVVVDGGLLSNFPIALFDQPPDQGPPPWPTLGVKFMDGQPSDALADDRLTPVKGVLAYGRALLETMSQFYDRMHLDAHSLARTIGVDPGGVSSTNFKLTRDDKQRLFENGRRAALEFLDHQWTFESYLAAFRVEAEHTGTRDLVVQHMHQAAAAIGLQPESAPEMPRAVENRLA
jgi:NTE family protein